MKSKRFLSLLLCAVLCLSLSPAVRGVEGPYPPSWCAPEDYVMIEGSNAYTGENWQKLLALRSHAEAGLTRDDPAWQDTLGRYWDQLSQAARDTGGKYDRGLYFELGLIDNKLYCNNGVWAADHVGYDYHVTRDNAGASKFSTASSFPNPKAYPQARYVCDLWVARSMALPNVPDENLAYALGNLQKYDQFTMAQFMNCEMFKLMPPERRAQIESILFVSLDGMPVHPGAVFLGGTKTEWTECQVLDGRTMVPVRHLAEMLGADVAWDGSASTITMTRATDTIVMTLDSRQAVVNGLPLTMDAAPYADGDRTYIPVRYMAEFFGQKVDWHPEKQLVTIVEDKEAAAPSNLEAYGLAMGAVLWNSVLDFESDRYGGMARSDKEGMNPGNYGVDLCRDALEEFEGVTDRLTLLKSVRRLFAETPSVAHPCWNSFRIASLAQWGYTAGWLTYPESLALTGGAMEHVQLGYTSWKDACEDAIQGCYAEPGRTWGRGQWREESRREMVEKLMAEGFFDGAPIGGELIQVPGLTFQDLMEELLEAERAAYLM